MKIVIWFFLLLSIMSSLYSQGMNDTMVYDNVPLDKYVFIDTMTFKLGEYVSTIDRPRNIYVLTNFLKNNPDLFVDIVLEKNVAFDTTTQHFQEISCQSIIDDLFYFNISSNQYRIRDTIIESYQSNANIAERRIRLKISRNRDYEKFLFILETYKHKNISKNELFSNISIEQILDNNDPKLSETITPLVDKHYAKYLRSYEKMKFINERNEIVYGRVFVDTFESTYYEDNDLDGKIYVTSIPDRTAIYSRKISNVNNLTYSPYFKKALDDFLGYDFEYEVDEFTNIPSNIIPKGKTKENLEVMKSIFDLEINDSFKGACKGHVFWGFEWVLKSPYSIRRILFDQYDSLAYIEYYSKYSSVDEVKYDLYELAGDKWEYKETIDHEIEKSYASYILLSLLGLSLLTLSAVKINGFKK
ncbi:hypothetical protein CEQ90_19710 [Lewinellaceae bacterium SD302]|nr:hypothetical protein CEQ90_19710 [Lewinellaceae bacterium SD302]